ncbi:MAG: sulfotransferase family protein [Gammaproteobacteria bacterium]|nr:sulfotransferase family protein [Gammaproteobacteria bacterium]
MHKILVLWATPRSTSTAFEWMMRMRGDLACFHEPFGEAWYKGEDARWPRIRPDSERITGLSFASVWDELLTAAAQGPVFSKDFPHYIEHLWSDEFLDHFKHSFLIRDPAKVTTSMYKHWPDFELKEVAFVEQRELFDRLCDRLGDAPPVIDSDDLLEDPFGMVEAYCNAVGIAYIEEALSWEPGDRDEVSWYDGGSWHANLRDSDGLKPQPRRYIDISAAPDKIKSIYETVLPHYEHLYAHRLGAV